MELCPGIHCVTVGPKPAPGLYPVNSYLLVGKDSAVFVDTGWDREAEIKERIQHWTSLGKPRISYILLTHRHQDHIGGARVLHDITGGTIVAHPVERFPIEEQLDGVKVGKIVGDGETLDLGGLTVEVVYTPGHTRGSLCFYVRERCILLTGDTVLGVGTTVINPDHGDLTLYLKSLKKLLSYHAESLYPGHGPAVHSPKSKLAFLVRHREEREKQILGILQGGSYTVDELRERMYPELASYLINMAGHQVRSHLNKLDQEGRVVSGDGGVTYVLSLLSD